MGAWGRKFALENINIEKAVEAYLDFYNGTDFKQKLIALKTQMFDLKKAHASELEIVVNNITKLQEQLTEQKLQTATLQTVYEAKGQKHLRAIRALLWLGIALTAILLTLVVIR